MTITRQQVAELQPGDVVELRDDNWPDAAVHGPLVERSWGLSIGDYVTIRRDGVGLPDWPERRHLTVVSRAPRPLYANHPRTEPVPGDVVRQPDGPFHSSAHTWHYLGDGEQTGRWWRFDDHHIPFDKGAPLMLLVDGETGQVVP